jgi:hypothetical protein
MKMRTLFLPIIVSVAATLVIGCSTTLQHGPFVGTTPASKGPLKVLAHARNTSQLLGWATIPWVSIPIVPVTTNGELDRELMGQVQAAMEHCGYEASLVENASAADGSFLVDCEVRRFSARNYTYVFPMVWNRSKMELNLIVYNSAGNVVFFNNYQKRAYGCYSFDKTVNLALTRVLNQAIPDLMTADFRAPAGHICPALRSDDVDVVIHALIALRRLKAPDIAPEILPLLMHTNEHVLRDACRTLAVLGDKDAIPSIEPLLQHPEEDVRKDAQKAIDKLRLSDRSGRPKLSS